MNVIQKSPTKGFGFWEKSLVVKPNDFIHKSLSNFACNIAVGCSHGCTFCSVPDTSARKLVRRLNLLGVEDPDTEWGDYAFLRSWKESTFMNSLRDCERIPEGDLKPDGNRAIIFCSTTDPYQIFARGPLNANLNEHNRFLMRTALERIRDHSTLRVRILTRSPQAKKDFDLFKSFGNRLVFGMSLPSLNDKIVKQYEPHSPGVLKRLETLKSAVNQGISTYVAIAPTYPECDTADLRKTLQTLKSLSLITIFHEPINVRAENVERMARHASDDGLKFQRSFFEPRSNWRKYAIGQLRMMQTLAEDEGLIDKLHLWPDADLSSKAGFFEMCQQEARTKYGDNIAAESRETFNNHAGEAYERHQAWIEGWWSRISEWPGVVRRQWAVPVLPNDPW